MMRFGICAALAGLLLCPPAAAEVTKSDPGGFVSTHTLTIAAPPEKLWDTIATPALWWSKDHSYSGDSANISWDTRPGGCWCETLEGGAVEHGRTLYAVRGKALRIAGAFGPLQSGAVNATMTFALKPEGQGTALTVTYVVGGYHPAGLATFATAVDGVIGAQMPGLKAAAEHAD
ncbi:SRPBCC domain-containing protein [Sphingomonas suaedae]|uniref:SRPBCC domain-containing protein n=1 Tax=Sphingomonas suaedae TaxID=2599297 RepID=A0A518RDK5_9SPHN|nr:SRPBCC domain-containing protein [Sphingomonas suaedae]QDX25550.1 SRPBCC domain-containing protein [Sphingomonas suaedae]